VTAAKAAIGTIQKILHEDGPALYPYFFNWLAGHADNVSDIQTTSLGHMILSKASKS
jgi:peptide/nickel transport system substrate-binding protein